MPHSDHSHGASNHLQHELFKSLSLLFDARGHLFSSLFLAAGWPARHQLQRLNWTTWPALLFPSRVFAHLNEIDHLGLSVMLTVRQSRPNRRSLHPQVEKERTTFPSPSPTSQLKIRSYLFDKSLLEFCILWDGFFPFLGLLSPPPSLSQVLIDSKRVRQTRVPFASGP